MATETCPHCGGKGVVELNVLRTLRERDKKKGNEVAAALGITQSAYSRMEAAAGREGGLRWNRHLRALAELYKVSTDQILGRVPLAAPKKNRPQRPPDARSLAKSAKARREIAGKNRRRSK